MTQGELISLSLTDAQQCRNAPCPPTTHLRNTPPLYPAPPSCITSFTSAGERILHGCSYSGTILSDCLRYLQARPPPAVAVADNRCPWKIAVRLRRRYQQTPAFLPCGNNSNATDFRTCLCVRWNHRKGMIKKSNTTTLPTTSFHSLSVAKSN